MDEREMKIVSYLPQNIRLREIKEVQPGVLEHFNQKNIYKIFPAIIFYVFRYNFGVSFIGWLVIMYNKVLQFYL